MRSGSTSPRRTRLPSRQRPAEPQPSRQAPVAGGRRRLFVGASAGASGFASRSGVVGGFDGFALGAFAVVGFTAGFAVVDLGVVDFTAGLRARVVAPEPAVGLGVTTSGGAPGMLGGGVPAA